jgi:hypothetical protein
LFTEFPLPIPERVRAFGLLGLLVEFDLFVLLGRFFFRRIEARGSSPVTCCFTFGENQNGISGAQDRNRMGLDQALAWCRKGGKAYHRKPKRREGGGRRKGRELRENPTLR